MEADGATATALPLTSHLREQHTLTPTTEYIDLVSLLTKPIENCISTTGLDFAFSIPAQPGTTGYAVHIGTYRSKTEACRAQHQLEQSDPHHSGISPFLSPRYTGVTRRSTALFLRRLPRTM